MRTWWAAVAIACSLLSTRTLALSAPADNECQELWLGVSLNGQQSDDVALFLRTTTAGVLAPENQLKAWRLRVPTRSTMTYHGRQYMPLEAIPGLKYSIDEDTQVLKLQAPARSFEQATLSATSRSFVPAPAPPFGGFLNYDVAAFTGNSHSIVTGELQASLFGPAGAFAMQYLVRHNGAATRALRLDTTWTVDHPDTASSFRIGDSITGLSAWGGAVRFAGIQWASNYTTQPGLITMPLPSIAGEAALPSSVSLYVDDALRMQNTLPSGPYRIDDVPVITGQGDVRLVVRDLLGREQVITEPYYASPRLLRAGLQEYSFESGLIRNNYGISSADYGRPLMVGTDRFGLNDQITAEGHAEVLQDQQTFGVSSAARVAAFGVVDASLAGSRSRSGQGELYGVGFEHSARELSWGGHIEYASSGFTRIGVLPDQPVPRLTSQLYVTLGLARLGSLSLSRTREDFYQARALEILSLRHSVNVGFMGYLTLSLIRTAANTSDTTVAVSLTHTLNARASASLATTQDSAGGTNTEIEVQQSLPAGRGLGYRLIAATGATRALDGTLDLQRDSGTYELEARSQSGSTQAQVSATGGFALLGGHVFPTREIDDSFAVVRVGDASGVRIYRENQLIGQTDSSGYALVPGLRAYQDNAISIEQADLPLDVVIDTLQVQAIPYFHSGVMLDFPIVHPDGALLAVRLENGRPLPAGALVRLDGRQDEFPSGTNGEVYVTGLRDHNELSAEWIGGRCRFSLPYSISKDPLPRLGPFVCKAALR
jgi:outer membrane usher protein